MKMFLVALIAGLSFGSPCFSHIETRSTLETVCLDDLLLQRHSSRSYDSSKMVTEEHIRLLVEAAHTAPSCYNDQPWRFLICHKQIDVDAYTKVLESLVEFNQNWAKPAPVLVVIVAHNHFTKIDSSNRWGVYDTGAAAFAMMLKATDLGLISHQMGGFDENKIRQDFAIPSDYTPMSIMAVGYETIAESQQIHEKDRRPISENFFKAKWDNPLTF